METLVRPVTSAVHHAGHGPRHRESCKLERRENLRKGRSSAGFSFEEARIFFRSSKPARVGRREKPLHNLSIQDGTHHLVGGDTRNSEANEHPSSGSLKKAGEWDNGFFPQILSALAILSFIAFPLATPLLGGTTLFIGNIRFYPEHEGASSVQSLLNVSSVAILVGAAFLAGNVLSALGGNQSASASSSQPNFLVSLLDDLFGLGRRRRATAEAAAAASALAAGGVGTSTWERFMASDPWANEVPAPVPTVMPVRRARKKAAANKVTQPGKPLQPSIPFPPRLWGDIEDKVSGALAGLEELEAVEEEEEGEGQVRRSQDVRLEVTGERERGREQGWSAPAAARGNAGGLPLSPSLSLQALQLRACCQLMGVTLAHLQSEVAAIPESKSQLSAQQWRLHCQDLLAAARGAVLVRWLTEAIPGRHISHLILSQGQTRTASENSSRQVAPLQTGANGASNGAVTTRYPQNSDSVLGAGGGGASSGVPGGNRGGMGDLGENSGFWRSSADQARGRGVALDADKADFYADLIYYLRFKQFRRPGSAWLEQSVGGASGALASALALEDLVTSVADSAAATYLSSVTGGGGGGMSWKGFALRPLDGSSSADGSAGYYGARGMGRDGGAEEVDGEEEEGEEGDESWPLLVHPSLSSTRALERFRNEVAFRGWLRRNFSSVAAMYEDCHEVVTIEWRGGDEGWPSAEEVSTPTQRLWRLLVRDRFPEGFPLSQRLRDWQQKKRQSKSTAQTQGGRQSTGLLGSPTIVEFKRRQVPVRRGKELRSLTGWRFVYSLYLEMVDVVGPVVKTLVKKISQILTFVLVTLIGRSIRILCSSIKKNHRSATGGT